MASILTNTAAMAALDTLRGINQSLEKTQSRVASGYRVQAAADNAAYWSIATTMRSDNKALSAVEDAIGLGAAKTDTAYTGLEAAVDIVSEIKAKLVAAREPGVDKDKINKEITELKNQIMSVAQSASFSGENWLYNDTNTAPGTKEMVGSFVRSGGNVSVQTLQFSTANSVLVDAKTGNNGLLTKGIDVNPTTSTTATYYLIKGAGSSGTGAVTSAEVKITSATTSTELDGMISAVEKMLMSLTDGAATLGAMKSRLELQENFVKDLMGTIDKGVGRLVDADMNEESTRLKALQTQQQLGIQALSIANTSADNILSLFRQ